MLAKAEDDIPVADGLLYEPKWDGFRAVVFRDGDDVQIASRNGQPLLRYFPELAGPLQRALPDAAVVDGEIVIPTERGLDFDALQLRLHPAESRVRKLAAATPSTFVVFDLLARGAEDLRPVPLEERRAGLLAAVDVNEQVVITPQTPDPEAAAEWFTRYEGAGLDGIMAKRRGQAYLPGERAWVKVKHRRTVDVVIGGFRLDSNGTGIGSLLLGLYGDDGTLHYVGHTSSFGARERRELLERLRPLEGESFGNGRAPGGPSRWSKGRESDWHSIRPELVAEVSFDHMQGPRFRHAARFIRWRHDEKSPRECDFSQLQRPEDFDLGEIISELGSLR